MPCCTPLAAAGTRLRFLLATDGEASHPGSRVLTPGELATPPAWRSPRRRWLPWASGRWRPPGWACPTAGWRRRRRRAHRGRADRGRGGRRRAGALVRRRATPTTTRSAGPPRPPRPGPGCRCSPSRSGPGSGPPPATAAAAVGRGGRGGLGAVRRGPPSGAAVDCFATQVRPLGPGRRRTPWCCRRVPRALRPRRRAVLRATGSGEPVTLPGSYFDDLYAGADDPWSMRTRWYERRKYAADRRPCCPGSATATRWRSGARSASSPRPSPPRCDRLTGWDVSAAAVDRARQRTAGLPGVRVEQRAVPGRPAPAGRPAGALRGPRTTWATTTWPPSLAAPPRAVRPGARCSPSTGGTRWPTTRSPATPCTRRCGRRWTGRGSPSTRSRTSCSTAGWPRPRATPGRPRSPRPEQARGERRARRLLGVVVPARDEEELLPACLAALHAAVAHPGRRRRAGARRRRRRRVHRPHRRASRARGRRGGARSAAGRRQGQRRGGPRRRGPLGARRAAARGVPPERLWVATHRRRQHRAAPTGCWCTERRPPPAPTRSSAPSPWRTGSGTPPHVAEVWRRAYDAWRGTGPGAVHPHVHGANLGVRGSAYLRPAAVPGAAAGRGRRPGAGPRAGRRPGAAHAGRAPCAPPPGGSRGRAAGSATRGPAGRRTRPGRRLTG